MARKLAVEIVGDSKSLERAFARSSRSAKTFQASITGVSRGISSSFAAVGVGLGATGIAAGIQSAIDAASDLNEEASKSRVLFGRSADTIGRWSKTTADAIGLSSEAALEAAGNFGAMFDTIGVGDRQSASMSKRLVQLGADMASFNNQDPTEMLDRLRSGLAGEAEPLRRFGVLLSEARVKQEAYRSGIARSGAVLTEQQKVQARYNLILRDTQRQQGDFARTSENLANQQRKLRAHFADLSAQLGTALLPSATKLVDKLNSWLADGKNQERLVDDLTTGFEALGTAFDTLATAIDTAKDSWDTFASVRDKVRREDKTGVFNFLLMGPGEVVKRLRDVPWKHEGEKAGEGYTLGFNTAVREHLAQVNATIERQRAAVAGRRGAAATARRPGITAAQRNQFFDARIARQINRLQDVGLRQQLARLRQIALEIRGRMTVTDDLTRRLTLEDKLLDVLREQRTVQQQIGDQIRAANQALRERADAIKSAVLERLQQRQARIENQRALRDAQARLREAVAIGGPRGARLARENLQDVRMDILRSRIEAAPPSLTRGGRFALGNVITINVHGVTDPDAVARKVAEVLQRRRRHTTIPQRGPGAGTPAGAH